MTHMLAREAALAGFGRVFIDLLVAYVAQRPLADVG
jgi:hypothetical protein